ncbi:uncharacterized protein LOC129583867 [Paramacrobiotus metropolitanus]|uniref:uncharacterized protein LOC129583867 n=1 Tax=Paramacrobiotus metropolitanus TaxID=2943436 RepID=UPI00244623CF|nr:uncharacterized protein LOC129583867 [Paramacrobiotus metropolitanus]
MFRCYLLEKLIYVHPNFLKLWYNFENPEKSEPFRLSRHLLQCQLVNHVLQGIGLVVIVTDIWDIKDEYFDPVDGGIFVRVRFRCKVYSPVPRSIMQATVEKIEPDAVIVRHLGLPSVRFPLSSLHPETLFNAEQKSLVWKKTQVAQADGSAKYFETKVGDKVKYQVDKVEYDEHKRISPADSDAWTVHANMKTVPLGPVHWYSTFHKHTPAPAHDLLKEALNKLDPDQSDRLRFLRSVLPNRK